MLIRRRRVRVEIEHQTLRMTGGDPWRTTYGEPEAPERAAADQLPETSAGNDILRATILQTKTLQTKTLQTTILRTTKDGSHENQ